MSNSWYVVHTHPHAEGRAFENLVRQGFSPYLPRYSAERRHARKVERVLRPLFPRYLFVQLELAASRWRAILSTLGVAGIICHGEVPTAVPPGVVEDIRRREVNGLIPMDHPPALVTGQRVVVAAGPFEGSLGVFTKMTDHQRVVVLLDMLGRGVPVTLPETAVIPARA